jgi:CIC family chloride channel protein
VDQEGRLTGIVTHYDYRDVVFEEDLKDLVVVKEVATPNVVTVSIEDNLYDAMEKITSKDFSLLPVISNRDPRQLLGVLTRRDIISAYNRAITKKPAMPR